MFSHNLIGLLRLIASDVSLAKQFADVYLRIAFKEIIVLIFQAEMAVRDQDPDFANYSSILARKCFESIIALSYRVQQNAVELAQSGQLGKILESQELAAICAQLSKKFGRFKDYKLAKINIFCFLALEMLTILRDAHKAAKDGGHEMPKPLCFDLLEPYELVKQVLREKQYSFFAISQLLAIEKQEPEWATVEAGDGWIKLELNGS